MKDATRIKLKRNVGKVTFTAKSLILNTLFFTVKVVYAAIIFGAILVGVFL